MTRTEIIEELRRSAREDADPYGDMDWRAWAAAEKWRGANEIYLGSAERTFCLIVAHALEDE